MSVFGKNQGPTNKVKRNAFDLSFQNHLTFNFGQLVPCFCKEVIPGDTFEIDSAFGLNFLPTAFPVQSKINANIHYFYVRNRTLWKDWYDFYFGTKDGLVSPYLDREVMLKKSQLHVSSLIDYFGLPVTYSGDQPTSVDITRIYPISESSWNSISSINTLGGRLAPIVLRCGAFDNSGNGSYLFPSFSVNSSSSDKSLSSYLRTFCSPVNPLVQRIQIGSGEVCSFFERLNPISLDDSVAWSNFLVSTGDPKTDYCAFSCAGGNSKLLTYCIPFEFTLLDSSIHTFDLEISLPANTRFERVSSACSFISSKYNTPKDLILNGVSKDFDLDSDFVYIEDETSGRCRLIFKNLEVSDFSNGLTFACSLFFCLPCDTPVTQIGNYNYSVVGVETVCSNIEDFVFSFSPDGTSGSSLSLRSIFFTSGTVSLNDSYDSVLSPYLSEDVTISALPFRAYEMIYNSFYRDARNNPYVLDGDVQYNQFIPSLEGGKDSNIYPLRYRNWEYDFLTTSQPTPQFGNAPLVGISSTGTMTFQASEDGKEYNVHAQVGEDGTTVESVSYTENLPNSVARSLVDVVSSGISINDFRNVNSFQRFLETTMRRGLKAVDQLKAHFDVDASYNALDMPEFIGGISTVVDAQKVNNLNGDGSAPLGDYAGQLTCIGNQRHKVRCYCDEPGFIIGIVCVHPVPLYSQLLPKFFLKRSNLDYFFPEFGHIGLQPILMREVAPAQVSNDSSVSQTDVFGYQRAWYDYLSSVDEVHGLFKTQLRDYVINRQFDGVPRLSPDFTVINPNHLNDIFTVQDISDKILGKIVFNVKAVRPIPKYGIPKID